MRKVASQAETNPPHLRYTLIPARFPASPYARAADFQSASGRFLFSSRTESKVAWPR